MNIQGSPSTLPFVQKATPMLWVVLYYSAFWLLVYLSAITFNTVDHDGAATILYHAFGRDPQIQLPYSAYHSGFDVLLSVFPSEIHRLKAAAINISFFTNAIGMFLLVYWIHRFQKPDPKLTLIFAFCLPFLVPELIFNGLIVNATAVGFVFMMLSLICFEMHLERSRPRMLLLSATLFGVAVAFRWPLLLAVTLFAGLYVLRSISAARIRAERSIILLYVSGLMLSGVLFIFASGISFTEMYEQWRSAQEMLGNYSWSLTEWVGMSVAFLTPGVVVFFLIALFSNGNRIRHLIFLIFASIPYLIIGFKPNLKYTITLLPMIILLVFIGMQQLYQKRSLALAAMVVVVFVPWVMGIQVHKEGLTYGPGFEQLQWDEEKSDPNSATLSDLGLSNIEIGPSAGLALPTIEGPRSLWGFAYVFFDKGWKSYMEKEHQEREVLLNAMEKFNVVYLIHDGYATKIEVCLLALGYHSNTPAVHYFSEGNYRAFIKGDQRIRILPQVDLLDHQHLLKLAERYGTLAVFTNYASKRSAALFELENVKRKGPFTGFYYRPEGAQKKPL